MGERSEAAFVAIVELLGHPVQQQDAVHLVHVDQAERHAIQRMVGAWRRFGAQFFHFGPDRLHFLLQAMLEGISVQTFEFFGLAVQQYGRRAQVLGLQQGQFAVGQVQQMGADLFELAVFAVFKVAQSFSHHGAHQTQRLGARLWSASAG